MVTKLYTRTIAQTPDVEVVKTVEVVDRGDRGERKQASLWCACMCMVAFLSSLAVNNNDNDKFTSHIICSTELKAHHPTDNSP